MISETIIESAINNLNKLKTEKHDQERLMMADCNYVGRKTYFRMMLKLLKLEEKIREQEIFIEDLKGDE
tara:strand:+ start:7616 stop:7822 length:207 start_codon:yes stop_codon:yes gene_type:complete